MPEDERRTAAIRKLNDEFRKTGLGGRVYLTRGVDALPQERQRALLSRIRQYENFNPENAPYGEHDFGSLTVRSEKAYFKIDYYDRALAGGSPDPADPSVTPLLVSPH